MILFLLRFLGGWYVISGRREQAAAFLDLCMRERFVHWRFCYTDDEFCCRVSRRGWRRLSYAASWCGIALCCCAEHGLPRRIAPYRHRTGLILGAIFFCAILVLSGKFVWRIEVIGTEKYRSADVIEELSAQGFGIGTYIPRVEVNSLQNRLLLYSDRFAWLSINLIGTTARVEVVEQKDREMPTNDNAPANLIAAADGQIVQFSLQDGWTAVGIGDVVRAGDLLVSGIGERKDGGTQLVCAQGAVYAQVMHELSVEIPLTYDRKNYGKEKITEKSIIFFGKEIKLLQNTGILGESCDTINNERILTFFGGVSVPVAFRTQTQLPYTLEPASRTVDEALTLAEYRLRQQTDALCADRELISQIRSTTVTETSVRLDCRLFCIENIAQSSPILLGESD